MSESTQTLYQFRIDAKEKADTFAVFAEMGIKPAQALRWFFQYVRNERRLPFEVGHIPNEETIAAMNEARSRKRLAAKK